MQAANDKLIGLEEELFESKSVQKEMHEKMEALEDQVEELLNQNNQLHIELSNASRKIYHTIKSDPLDQKLGEYICQYPEREKLKILFIRESEGVYQFG